jgi:peptidoglycan/LPS O-acetylase OafA/YrhL
MKAIGYRHDLDLLKGIAIIAVILYHAGVCKSGYLGVDAFLVVSGYLTVPKVLSDIDAGRFRYFAFLEKRLFRLLRSYCLSAPFRFSLATRACCQATTAISARR